MKTKHLILVFLAFMLLVTCSAYAEEAHEMYIVPLEVYDGDTIKTQFPWMPPLDKVSIRIYGIDTPESPAKSYATTGKLGRAHCIKEAELALAATKFVKSLVKGKMLRIKSFEWGKFGGRIVADVYIAGTDINIADELIKKDMAVEYFGEKKSKDWCK